MSEISTLATDFNFMGTVEGVGDPPPPAKPQKPYSPQEIEYVAELLRNGGFCARAARKVGFTDSQARGACHWIQDTKETSTKPHLWDLYQRELTTSRAKLSVTIEKILDEYSCIAFMDPLSLQDDKGNILPLGEMDHRTRRAISKIRFTRDVNNKMQVCDVQMYDKKGVLDSLAKIMGMLSEKVEHTHSFTGLLDQLSAGDEPLVVSPENYKEVYEDLDG